CVEVMPAFEISIVPNRLVRLIPSAKAVRGKASASTIRINAAFICKSPVVKLTPISRDPPLVRGAVRHKTACQCKLGAHIYAPDMLQAYQHSTICRSCWLSSEDGT